MTPPRKVAFAAVFSSACIHRRMRGALSYADANPHIVIRDFRMPLDLKSRGSVVAEINALKAWKPDGLLTFMDNQEFEILLKQLGPDAPPIVSMAAVTPRPGVALVGGSMPKMIEMAVQHFRQQGIRSLGMLKLDHDPVIQERGKRVFCEISKPADPSQAVHVEEVPTDLPADLERPVEPVPPGLAGWLRRLPKPVGVLTVDYGGGNYLVRVCHALGLKVPDEVAVMCADDVDLCLSSSPTLSSVEAASEIIGREAMKTLDRMMQGDHPDNPFIRVEAVDIHVRQSTGKKIAEVCDMAGAINHINQQACNGLTVERLLKETQRVSKMTFHKRFVSATGQTPGEAIRQRQFAEARRLLAETKLSVTLVAEQSGFGSSSDFARAFRAAEGVTPRQFRDQAHLGSGPSKPIPQA
ncbi:substrate-binding domain-containing protein [Luteolibacter luteus]|uniref:Substrate-binding domain-containing protein n=1 Tax=Luteolibacter luteus TaxID=2728835 RepID=A0A858RHG9_9BACT|nr:substrate-binding domain-containing protein [Luteolibacter luteus]QJE95710.1 substrate-binding domain-containing protein [Luteolibacter luteus]